MFLENALEICVKTQQKQIFGVSWGTVHLNGSQIKPIVGFRELQICQFGRSNFKSQSKPISL